MIFSPELAKLILQGRKTMTRRPVKAGEKACRYRENRAYSIQPGRGKRGIGKLTVVSVRPEKLGDILIKDVRAEGFSTRQELVDYWTRLHGHFDPDVEVWVISFVLGDRSGKERYLAAAPSTQLCSTVLEWRILPNGKKKAARRCGRVFIDGEKVCGACGARRPEERMDDHGYTTLPHKGLKGEQAAIPPELQERYSKEGRERHTARKQRELRRRQRLSPAERLARLEAESRELGIDISSETRLIEQRAGRAERQIAAPTVPSDG
jgi:hypothetical protein